MEDYQICPASRKGETFTDQKKSIFALGSFFLFDLVWGFVSVLFFSSFLFHLVSLPVFLLPLEKGKKGNFMSIIPDKAMNHCYLLSWGPGREEVSNKFLKCPQDSANYLDTKYVAFLYGTCRFGFN